MSIDAPIVIGEHWFVGENRLVNYAVVDKNGDPQDVTGFALEWVLRDGPGGATALITKATGDGITTPAPTGSVQVAIVRADTLNLAPGHYFYTIRRTDTGNERVLAFGDAHLQQAATR